MEHFRKLENVYRVAPINQIYKPELEISEGAAELRMVLTPTFHHSAGATHGSVYFKALDDATFFAANSLVEEFFMLTAKFELTFIRPVISGVIVARARVTKRDENRIYAEGELFTESNDILAKGSGSFAVSPVPLTPAVGYTLEIGAS